MPINMQGGEYNDPHLLYLNPPFIDTEPSNRYIIFDELDNTHLAETQAAMNSLYSKIIKSFEDKPIQLHFEFYNERHHKPKKKKLKVEYICPF